ncbi:MAG: radical SAM family heme chaperone HemW [Thermodesulfobacteriota bacterium]|jgi:oxygen-independent coproporphyrinogen-3 oxidase
MVHQISEPLNSSFPQASGLYVHIPFCQTKCPYCNFYSVPQLSKIPDFLDALLKEIAMAGSEWDCFDTVYIGGGTPSVLGPQQLEKILSAIRNYFPLAPGTEITLETNPADLHLSYLTSLKEIGINRLNLGIQSFDPKTLQFLGRRHSVRDAISALEGSRQVGFDHMGLDLIYGVPGQRMESWINTLSQAIAFSPEHISCYQLTLEEDTPLGISCHQGNFSFPPEEELFDFFMVTAQKLEEGRFIHYEVSNFAREDRYASRHNQKYWNHTPYLGLGPAAHSFSGRKRWWNYRSVDQYISVVNAAELPIEGSENLSLEQLRMEAFFLGLRTKKGIDVKDFCRKYQYDLMSEKGKVLLRLQEDGFLSYRDGRLRPTRTGLAVADSLALL